VTSPSTAGSIKHVHSARWWVVSLLTLIHIAGDIAGRNLWPLLYGGKDPQIEFACANIVAFALFAVFCFVSSPRLSRLRLLHVIFAFSLGVLSSVIGMVWGVMNGYGR
jgi:hypothetical protein